MGFSDSLGGNIFGFQRLAKPNYGPYTTAFNAFVITQCGSGLTPAELTALTQFETDLGSNILEFDRLWIFGLSKRCAAQISFVNSGLGSLKEMNSPTWTANVGYTGNGSTSYLDLMFNPFANGVKYTLNNGSFGYYSRTNISQSSADMGVGDSSLNSYTLIYPNLSGTLYPYINQGGSTTLLTGSTTTKLIVVERMNAALTNTYRNGVLSGVTTFASTALAKRKFYGLGWNNDGTLAAPSTRQISLMFIGSKNFNMTTVNNSIQTLGTTLGWAV